MKTVDEVRKFEVSYLLKIFLLQKIMCNQQSLIDTAAKKIQEVQLNLKYKLNVTNQRKRNDTALISLSS